MRSVTARWQLALNLIKFYLIYIYQRPLLAHTGYGDTRKPLPEHNASLLQQIARDLLRALLHGSTWHYLSSVSR